ncbi:MAG TPA: 50S ribosomal protein L15 [Bacteroidetes bacterium]|nr:50S ribosomal protein L15 [Bacteroidota bacterium]
MELHNLKPAKGAVKKAKKVIGRGQGSGKGGTATRGHKGAKSRSGYKRKRNYEGGQTPLQMRLPKRGFKNRFRTEYVPMNVNRLQEISQKYSVTEINPEFLIEKNIIGKSDLIKVLGNGDIDISLTVVAHKYSESAKKKIEEKGGSIKLV